MSEPTNADIMLAIGRLEGGVIGINQRLDQLNGRTTKTEKRVEGIELARAKEKGYVVGAASVVSLVWAIGGALVAAVWAYFNKST